MSLESSGTWILSFSIGVFGVVAAIEKFVQQKLSKPVQNEFKLRDMRIDAIEKDVKSLTEVTGRFSEVHAQLAKIDVTLCWLKASQEALSTSIVEKLDAYAKETNMILELHKEAVLHSVDKKIYSESE